MRALTAIRCYWCVLALVLAVSAPAEANDHFGYGADAVPASSFHTGNWQVYGVDTVPENAAGAFGLPRESYLESLRRAILETHASHNNLNVLTKDVGNRPESNSSSTPRAIGTPAAIGQPCRCR